MINKALQFMKLWFALIDCSAFCFLLLFYEYAWIELFRYNYLLIMALTTYTVVDFAYILFMPLFRYMQEGNINLFLHKKRLLKTTIFLKIFFI